MVQTDLDGEYSVEELQSRLALFRQSAVLFNLQEGQLRALARTMLNAVARKGTAFITQDRPNNYFFILRTGRCRIVYQTSPGHTVTIAILNPGDCLGEGAIMGGQLSSTSVVADTDCQLVAATSPALVEVLPKESPFWRDLSKIREQRHLLLESVLHSNVRADTERGKVIVIYSPKGGVGKSVVAVNLAATLAMDHPGEVVLFDLALPFNHAVVMAGLVPTTCLARVDPSLQEGEFEEAVLTTTVRHPSGLQILPSALRAEDADRVTVTLIQRTLSTLVAHFKYVLVDTRIPLSESVLSAFDAADQIILLGSYELAAIKDLEEVLALFDQVLKIAPARVLITFNKRQEKPPVSRKDIEGSLARAIDFEIPFVGNVLEMASVKGEVPVVTDRKGAFAKSMTALAKRVELMPVGEAS